MAGNTSAGAGESSAQDRSGSGAKGSANKPGLADQGGAEKLHRREVQCLELNQHHHVMHLLPEVDCGPKAWTVLKELHAPTSVVATLMLERELSTLRLSEGEPVQPVLDKMRDLYSNGLSMPQNQSLWTLEWVRTKILEEDFRRRQLRGGDDGSSGYGMQGSKRGRGRGFSGAGRGAKKDDDSNDQQGGTGWGRGAKSGRGDKSGAGGKMKGSCWYCEKEGHPWFLCYKKPDGWTPQNRHQDGGERRNQKNGANMVADSSDNNPKGNGGAEKKKERTAGQFFHIGEQGEQGDASAKVGAELHPLDYWVLDTGAAWTMMPRKELLDDVRAAPINEVCSASGQGLETSPQRNEGDERLYFLDRTPREEEEETWRQREAQQQPA
ncbi:unnamed protein product [Closterium sp. NIES-53]